MPPKTPPPLAPEQVEALLERATILHDTAYICAPADRATAANIAATCLHASLMVAVTVFHDKLRREGFRSRTNGPMDITRWPLERLLRLAIAVDWLPRTLPIPGMEPDVPAWELFWDDPPAMKGLVEQATEVSDVGEWIRTPPEERPNLNDWETMDVQFSILIGLAERILEIASGHRHLHLA